MPDPAEPPPTAAAAHSVREPGSAESGAESGSLPKVEGGASRARLWPWVRLCAIVAGVCSLTWISEPFSGSPLPPRTAYVSELFALGQPWAGYLRAVDGLAGTALIVGVVLAWISSRALRSRTSTGTRRLLAAALVGLGIFGLATVLDATMPMSCTPSTSVVCAAAEAAGEVPLRHQVHSVSSSTATLGAMIGFVSLAAAALRRHRRVDRWKPSGVRLAITTLATVAVAAYILATIWVLVEIAGGTPGSPLVDRVGFGALGWSQRLQVSLSAICLFLTAIFLPHPDAQHSHSSDPATTDPVPSDTATTDTAPPDARPTPQSTRRD